MQAGFPQAILTVWLWIDACESANRQATHLLAGVDPAAKKFT
jgi:hypothetical protein